MNHSILTIFMNIFIILLNELDCFLMKYREMGLIISLMFLLILITLLVFAIFGTTSAVESGTYYNHLGSMI